MVSRLTDTLLAGLKVAFALLAVCLIGALGVAGSVQAATIGYWRFEDGPGFLRDSSPNGLDLQNSNGVVQVSSAFGNAVPQTGAANAKAADFEQSTGQWLYRQVGAGDPLYGLNCFTIEAYVNLESAEGNVPRSIASQYHYTVNQKQRQWNLNVTHANSNYGSRNLLMILSDNGEDRYYFDSNFQLTLGTNYYVAAAVDVDSTSGTTIGFYFKDLDAAGSHLQHCVVTNADLKTLHDATGDLRIGAEWSLGNPKGWDGLLDEVRLSDTLLSENQLLCVSVLSVPEPSTFLMCVPGLLGLGWYGWRRRRGVWRKRIAPEAGSKEDGAMARMSPTAAPCSTRSSLPTTRTAAILWAALAALAVACVGAEDRPKDGSNATAEAGCSVLADRRLEEPVRAIVAEYHRRTCSPVEVNLLPAEKLGASIQKGQARGDVVICLEPKGGDGAVGRLEGAKAVAWTHGHPGGDPVWAAALSNRSDAKRLVQFFGGPTGHQLWSERSDLTIVPDMTANAYDWVVRHRVAHTYPMTAERVLRECGGIREGVCIDVGCGTGMLDIELAKRSNLTIVGLDIEPGCQPLFEKNVREAGLEDRVRFVLGDAQKLPFPDDYADLIVSRGTLIFIPDVGKALREADRVLKPTGAAFLGGRYLYAPREHRIATERLREIVYKTGIAGAEVIDARGQWVKILGPEAPPAARQFQGGPEMLAGRIVADYYITEGRCLLVHRGDGGLEQALQQGLLELTRLNITAIYPNGEAAEAARQRIRQAKHDERITCRVGDIHSLPFEDRSFDLVAGVGPVLIWGDRPKAMREIYRVLAEGGAGLVGGRYLYMPEFRKVSSEALRQSAAETGIPSIRIIDDMGQWVEIRKGIKDRGFCD